MNFAFELPRSNRELLDDANCSNYFVKQVYNPDEIPPLLRGKCRFFLRICTIRFQLQWNVAFGIFLFVFFFFFSAAAHQALKAGDAFYIFDHFDVFFSIIENVAQLQISHSLRAIDILYQTAESMGHLLSAYLGQDTFDRQNDFLNLIKMVMYLMVSSVRAIDSFIKKNSQESPASRKNKRTTGEQSAHLMSYGTKRFNMLIQVCNIMQLPIEKLWNMSTIDEDFIK